MYGGREGMGMNGEGGKGERKGRDGGTRGGR